MLETLRIPFFLIAVVLMVCVVLIEMGTSKGFGIPYLVALDGLLLLSVLFFAASLFKIEWFLGKVQGVLFILITLTLLPFTINLIMDAFTALLIKIVLSASPLWGPPWYSGLNKEFAKSNPGLTLSLIMTLKLAFVGFLFLAHQKFLQNKGLVLIVLTSLFATIVISFLHGISWYLLSITDAISGIVVGILAVIWCIFFLVTSIPSIWKARKGWMA